MVEGVHYYANLQEGQTINVINFIQNVMLYPSFKIKAVYRQNNCGSSLWVSM
jgi:hypothetical protein